MKKETFTERLHAKTKAEMGVMSLQAKDHQATKGSWKGQEKNSSHSP